MPSNPRDHADLTNYERFSERRRFVSTDYGEISVVENGAGPVAVFLHGFPLNGFHWRYQLTELAVLRRCVAIDLLGLGHTRARRGQDLSFASQAAMVLATLDQIGVDEFDLVGNDSGSGVAQLVATAAPHRIRSLVLTNGDVHDNFPPEAAEPVRQAAAEGALAPAFESFLNPANIAVAQAAFATVFEQPAHLEHALIDAYLAPLIASTERRESLHRFMLSLDPRQTIAIRDDLAKFRAPTSILWATADPFFDVRWAYWLRDLIPGTVRVVELSGAKLFFPEERPDEVNAWLRTHWETAHK